MEDADNTLCLPCNEVRFYICDIKTSSLQFLTDVLTAAMWGCSNRRQPTKMPDLTEINPVVLQPDH